MNVNRLLRLLSKLRGNPAGAKVAIKSFLGEVPTLVPMEFEGNFIATIGANPSTIFCAHYDTVDPVDIVSGTKTLVFRNHERTILGLSAKDTSGARCLGADDGAGCEILACLYEAGVPGIYIWSAEEETGCKGTKRLLRGFDNLLDNITKVISFDRRGTEDIITHQMGYRTCSDAFAQSLRLALGMNHKLNDGGSYTDSFEYALDVAECTNIAVGYQCAHFRGETLNLTYLKTLIESLVSIQWEELPIEREPGEMDKDDLDAETLCYEDPAFVYRWLCDMDLDKELEDYARWVYDKENPKEKTKEIKVWNPDNDHSDPFYRCNYGY